jgi:GNAT superfamily N-acetyltransferase
MKTKILTACVLLILATALTSYAQSGFRPRNDFNGDDRTDLAVYHASTGNWYIRSYSGTIIAWAKNWGFNGALPVPEDYDGDGIWDLAVYDPAAGNWYIVTLSGRILAWARNWGFRGAIPVPGDFNGDGKAELAVYDPNAGNWYIQTVNPTSIVMWAKNWGFKGDVRSWERPPMATVFPVPYDFDRDGTDDLAIYYRGYDMPSSYWWIYHMPSGRMTATNWGSSSSIPAPGYYRSAIDQRSGMSVYHIPVGTWNIPNMLEFKLGTYGECTPVPMSDFDGNGYDDSAVYYHRSGNWQATFNDADGNSVQPPTINFNWGFNGAIPATVCNTMYTLCNYFYYTKHW